MNPANFALASGLVSPAYVQQGQQALAARSKLVTNLLSQRKLPMQGWDDASIEMLLQVNNIDAVVYAPDNLGGTTLASKTNIDHLLLLFRMQLQWTATTF